MEAPLFKLFTFPGSLMDEIDPYHKWLGIPKKHQPATFYRLLGIEAFEHNPEVIAAAASRQVAYLHQLTSGPHRRQIQKLMNEIAQARRTLIDEQMRAKYDEKLRSKMASAPSVLQRAFGHDRTTDSDAA